MGDAPLFESRGGKGRTWYKLYAFSVLIGAFLVFVYRAAYIPKVGEGRWLWIGVLCAELWFCFYWILTQSVRWNPTYYETFRNRLSKRHEDRLPGVDVFVCTADSTIEPPIMVINTVLSVMAYNYPADKLSVYLSDDGGSELTFYALLEASRFARMWIPFCRKFNVQSTSPAAYFEEESSSHKNGVEAADWLSTKSLYKEMENRISEAVKLGRVAAEHRKQHKGFHEWNSAVPPRDHQAIVQILIDGRDPTAVDDDGSALPTLVYMSREKRLTHHHHFKAGAMNSLLRCSSEISNGAVILNLDCDMNSNNSETVRDALCFLMDENRGHEYAYVQFPQCFRNITKNDLYNNSMRVHNDIDFPGMNAFGGPLYIGSGCFHRREGLMGQKYDPVRKAKLEQGRRNSIQDAAAVLETKTKSLVTCSFEDNTEWGKEVGLKYGCPVEDVITGLSIQCRGWKSIYHNPARKAFLGVAPLTLAQTLVQRKRWSEGDFQIFVSKYCPFFFGHGKIKLGLQMVYSIYCLWAPCSLPTMYYLIVVSLSLLHGINFYPSVRDVWFVPFAYVSAATLAYSLVEAAGAGYTFWEWWNEQRMWLFLRLASYPFAVVDTFLKLLGVGKSSFVVTAKVVDDEVETRYQKEIMEFGGAPSLMFTIIAATAAVAAACLAGGAARVVILSLHDGGDIIGGVLGSMLMQLVICGAAVALYAPVYQAMFLRSDGGRMPTSTTITSLAIAMVACMFPLQYIAF